MAAGHQAEEKGLEDFAKANELTREDTEEELSPAERELLRLEKVSVTQPSPTMPRSFLPKVGRTFQTNSQTAPHLVELYLKEINANLDRELAAKGDAMLWPTACWFIVPNEFGERFAYYGVKGLFAKYLTGNVGFNSTQSTIWTSNFTSIAYFSPLLGAALSDGYLGKYHTIVGLSAVYAIGMALLAILSVPGLVPYADGFASADNGGFQYVQFWTWCLPVVLIGLGTGGIKPCVSSHGGDQYLPHQYKGLDFFFSIFYVAINLGSLISGYVMPEIKNRVQCFGRFCYFYPYLICAIVFTISALVFASGYKKYRIVPPRREFLPGKAVKTVSIAASRFFKADRATRTATGGWLNFAAPVVGAEFVEETILIGRVLMMVLPVAFFWMVYDQGQNEWQFQLDMMKSPGIPVESFGNMNTIFIITMVPTLTFFYRWLERKNIRFTILQRMGTGFFIMFLSYLLSGIMQKIVIDNYDPVNDKDCNNCINGWWQTPQWFLLSLGEAMLSPEGLKLVYMNSGKQFRSQSASLWLAMSGFGDLIITAVSKALEDNATFNDTVSPQATLNPDHSVSLPSKYWLFAGLCLAANLWFVLWAKFVFQYKDTVGSMTTVPRKGEREAQAAAYAKAKEAVAEEGERTIHYKDMKGGEL
ncbi:hypothetical protein HDU90_007394 [Geranomyces variabilis]|nr:hypothetical protein HDU90_007394 [Geranomyces variabilis]